MKCGNKLILWDLDGTLMTCGAIGTKALNETFRKLYGLEDAFSKAGIGHGMDSVILEKVMKSNSLDQSGLDGVKKEYNNILTTLLADDTNKRVLPGVKELLEYTDQSKTVFNALLTSNLRMGAEAKLMSVGLSRFFHTGGFGDDHGEKWDAALTGISAAEEYFGVRFEKSDICMIGDSIYDIECAKRIGVPCISVATGFADYEMLKGKQPDYLYKDLSDWQGLLKIHKWE